ncbi:MAG: type I restriction enzyme HsdR N-terminal domain-containing protein [Bacteroidales bacterium]|nr:type I restriction enzyme HsdR N-terminal domain-containing protein [Lentimicrobiaceae bacterium]MDD5695783.1 type I restriction enzyme HsdR N-terminal domain-containing protein [Bacteroidales bacterium]
MNDLPVLNFPGYSLQIQEQEGQRIIFDIIRRRYVHLTPEEWVRQHMIHFLISQKHVPPTLIAVEKVLRVYKLKKRLDIAVFNSAGQPLLLVECKSPDVILSQTVFDQIARYNLSLNVRYLVVTNGMVHYCCQRDESSRSWNFLTEIPDYHQMQ